jgi:hypothetical protein
MEPFSNHKTNVFFTHATKNIISSQNRSQGSTSWTSMHDKLFINLTACSNQLHRRCNQSTVKVQVMVATCAAVYVFRGEGRGKPWIVRGELQSRLIFRKWKAYTWSNKEVWMRVRRSPSDLCVHNKSIHENFKLVANTAKHLHRRKSPTVLMKIDISKAFG